MNRFRLKAIKENKTIAIYDDRHCKKCEKVTQSLDVFEKNGKLTHTCQECNSVSIGEKPLPKSKIDIIKRR